MSNSHKYSFTTFDTSLGEAGFRPYLPITLIHCGQELQALGLLDTGSTVNVLPYQLGLEIGANWQDTTTSLQLTGNLAQFEARVLILLVRVADFEAIKLVFAWTEANNVPLIFGQVNFFMEFNVCFYRSHLSFDVSTKNPY